MMKVSTPTLQMSAGGPTTSPFNISGAKRRRKGNAQPFFDLQIVFAPHENE